MLTFEARLDLLANTSTLLCDRIVAHQAVRVDLQRQCRPLTDLIS